MAASDAIDSGADGIGTGLADDVLGVALGAMALRSPILSASGTFGAGLEGQHFASLQTLGGLVSKTVTVAPRPGNPPPRLAETASGMLNSIGLENRGADWFLEHTLPRMRALGTRVIVNIGGESADEFVQLGERFAAAGVDALEVNLSCPNVQGGKLLFSSDPTATEAAVRQVRDAVPDAVPVFAKLSPNVTDITAIAKAAEAGGADGLTLINTLIGMAVDWRKRRPVLALGIGGLSGPAIKPVALRMVHQVRANVSIPILGVGGIATAEDVLEFLCAGANAVQIGTANFVDPLRMTALVDEVRELLLGAGTTAAELTGTCRVPPRRRPGDAAAAPSPAAPGQSTQAETDQVAQ